MLICLARSNVLTSQRKSYLTLGMLSHANISECDSPEISSIVVGVASHPIELLYCFPETKCGMKHDRDGLYLGYWVKAGNPDGQENMQTYCHSS